MNRVSLVGRVGRDPEYRMTQNGKEVLNFSVATEERWKDGDEWRKATTWHRVVVFNEYVINNVRSALVKGCLVAVEGAVQYRSYENKDGHTVNITEIVVSRGGHVLPVTPGSRTEAGEDLDDESDARPVSRASSREQMQPRQPAPQPAAQNRAQAGRVPGRAGRLPGSFNQAPRGGRPGRQAVADTFDDGIVWICFI